MSTINPDHALPATAEIPAESPLGRRSVLLGGAALAGVVAVAACGSGGSTSAPTTANGIGGATTETDDGSSTLAEASAIPVGGGVVVDAKKAVVTQPTAGNYRAFSAVCTHQGCLVGSVANNTIVCPCHNSAFSAVDGSATHGPATAALKELKITVAGGKISLA